MKRIIIINIRGNQDNEMDVENSDTYDENAQIFDALLATNVDIGAQAAMRGLMTIIAIKEDEEIINQIFERESLR